MIENSVAWAPHLFVALLLQAGAPIHWCLATICVCYVLGLLLMLNAAPWREVLQERRRRCDENNDRPHVIQVVEICHDMTDTTRTDDERMRAQEESSIE